MHTSDKKQTKVGFLEQIRTKSNAEKRQFAFNSALVITSIIFLVWVSITFYSFDLSGDTNQGAVSPLSSMISSAKVLFGFGR